MPQSTVSNDDIFDQSEIPASNACQKGVFVYSVNIQCLLAHKAELEYSLSVHRPHIVLIQETWLDASTEQVQISGYVEVSRRDRREGEEGEGTANRGGILTLQREDFGGLVHICNSKIDERSWHFLRLGMDTLLLANWYRSPSLDHNGFESLYAETTQYFFEVSGTLIMGDLNVHHRKWLRHSNGDTQIGTDLKTFCDYHGLFQLVKEPTRKQYLLDLAITDLPKSSATVLPLIADHKGVLVKLPLPEFLEVQNTRMAWQLSRANWKALERDLRAFDWTMLERGTAEDALNNFLEILWQSLLKHIPRKQIVNKKSTHPWLNDRCKNAIKKKNSAEGTVHFEKEQRLCTRILGEERAKYIEATKIKLANLPKGSKEWWRINRELMHKKAKVSSIPVLRDSTGTWITNATAKANALATTLMAKAQLPAAAVDTPFFGQPAKEFNDFVVFRSRTTRRLFKALDENTATGNDKISAAILKRLEKVLAVPFTRVCRRLFFEACWPMIWKFHLIVPIFKKGAAFQPGNYRGVHLTTILSKIAERLIGAQLVPFLQKYTYGENQWAFSTGLSSRDLVTMLVMSWILAICTGKQIGGYLSDISGAFDRVDSILLLAKLYEFGIGEQYLRFIAAYLQPRQGQVVVQGAFSDKFEIANSVYQGTVLGPPLWNAFFADVAVPASSTGGSESKFADDLNVFKEFPQSMGPAQVQTDLEKCKDRTHKWGRKNRVTFDAQKEHIVILHPSRGLGDPFKLLGLLMDADLRMHSAIDQLLGKVRPKVTAILRTRAYYSVPDLINQFKTQIWGLMEAHSGGLFHAATSLLQKIDHAQNRFLREICISAVRGFLEFNFAPPSLRRNIGILGLLHKRVLGKCHPSFQRLLPFYSERFDEPTGHGHTKKLYGHWVEISSHRALFNRSIFAMVDIYNALPQHLIDNATVSGFQSGLTQLARRRAEQGDAAWASTFSRRTFDGLDSE